MEYCVVEDGVITNIIVCENDNIAAEFGACSIYDGAAIGDEYSPPEPEPEPKSEPELTLEDRVSSIESAIERGLSL